MQSQMDRAIITEQKRSDKFAIADAVTSATIGYFQGEYYSVEVWNHCSLVKKYYVSVDNYRTSLFEKIEQIFSVLMRWFENYYVVVAQQSIIPLCHHTADRKAVNLQVAESVPDIRYTEI